MPAPIFTQTLTRDDSGWANYTWRGLVTPLSGGGSQIQVTFGVQGNGNVFACANVSVGIQSTNYDCTATPTELLFSGTSGFSLTAVGAGWNYITSDLTNFVFTMRTH